MIDFRDIRGQETAKRALEIALAGNLSLAIIGPRESGKSMLIEAARAVGPLDAIECLTIWGLPSVDLCVEISPTPSADIILPYPAEPSGDIARRVWTAWGALSQEYPDYDEMRPDQFLELPVQEPGRRLMALAAEAMRLEPLQIARAYKTALIISILAGSPEIGRVHVAEGLSYRPRNMERRIRSEAESRILRYAWRLRAAR